jgi:signal transduction histidine kinase
MTATTGRGSDPQARLLRVLSDVSATAGRNPDAAELVRLAAEEAGKLLDADAVVLYLWDEAQQLLVPAYSNDQHAPTEDWPLKLGQGAAGQAVLLRRPMLVPHYPTWEHAIPWPIERGLQSVDAVPLLVGDRPVGALVVRFYRPRTHEPGEARALSLLAAQVAPALEAARLYATSQLEGERERALREIAQALAANLDERQVLDLAVDHGARLLAAPYARVWLYESPDRLHCAAALGYVHAQTFERTLPADSTSGHAAGQPIVNLLDAPAEPTWRFNREFGQQTGLGAYLGAGLWRAGESLGVLEVMREREHRFTAAEEQLLSSLANAVAVAVSNARIHAEAERLACESQLREQALRQRDAILDAVGFAAGKLLTAADWEHSIDDVLRQLGLSLGVSRVYVVGQSIWHEWTASGVRPRTRPTSDTPYRPSIGLSRWEGSLREGGVIEGQQHAFPAEERATLEAEGVCSIVVVPIFAGAAWWGFIGFDDCQHERDWPAGVVEVLKTAASTLGAAIERRRAEAERLRLAAAESARSEAEAAQRRLGFLAEASRLLGGSLDYTTTLQSVARLVVPTLADYCAVELLNPDGTIRRLTVAQTASPQEPPRWRDIEPTEDHPTITVLRTGESLLYQQLPEQVVQALDLPHRGMFVSGLLVPLIARSGTLGVMTCLAASGRRPYAQQDLPLVEDLARRCAVAIDNARLYQEAREAISIRDEFLSVAAHELKTPLTSLRGYAQLLGREFERANDPHPERARRAALTIQVQSDKLSRLIGQLLDITRIQAGKLAIERKEADLAKLVLDVVEAERSQLRGHTLVPRVPETLLARIDPLRIEQVITNLLDNAIKYSPEGGQIDISLEPTELGYAQIRVRDRGVGIPLEHRTHIFDRFYQAHAGSSLTNMAGIGLGLHISRQIVELHGGTIEAEFPDDGGTCMVVTLPLT